MKILLSNDDGVHAEGLRALYETLSDRHAVVVIAPDRERTAISHAITLRVPIRAEKLSLNGIQKAYAVSGTPADCIKLAVTELLDEKPDLMVSGINPGANVGVDINYSGTLAAAREATLYGIPALAVSIKSQSPKHYGEAARFIVKLTEQIIEKGLPAGTFLNVNVPDLPLESIRGVAVSKQDTEPIKEYIEKRVDPRDRTYYWYGINSQGSEGDSELDSVAISEDYISVTPIKCDMTDHQLIHHLKEWDFRMT